MADDISAAEDALQRGFVDEALSLAQAALQQHKEQAQTAGDSAPLQLEHKARAINVLIQADFHFHNRLTDLEQLLKDSNVALEALPVSVVLLWGVVAVELQAAEMACATLGRYLAGREFGEGSGVSREDALALSRLYAVQLLSGLCQDFEAAAIWLDGGGAGLSEEQQELLLMEVEEAEELVQEEHMAAWTIQHAAEATQPGTSLARGGAGAAGGASAAAAAGAGGGDCGASTVSSLVACSVASTAGAAAMQELGPSASGVLSSCPSSGLHPEGSSCNGLLEDLQEQDLGSEAAAAAAGDGGAGGGGGGGDVAGRACGSSSGAAPQQHASAGPAAAEAVLLAAAGLPAAVLMDDREPSSPSLAGWRLADADESCLQDQCGRDDNPFVTLTGELSSEGLEVAAAAAAAAMRSDGGGRHSGSSAKSSGGRAKPASTASSAVAATAAQEQESEPQQETGQQQQQQQASGQHLIGQPSPQPQPKQQSLLQSYSSWANTKATEVWGSSRVQGTLRALNLQDVPPWELAAGGGLAVLVGYSLYRERRNLKRAAINLAAGVAETASMALGLRAPVNAMGVAPGTSHLMR